MHSVKNLKAANGPLILTVWLRRRQGSAGSDYHHPRRLRSQLEPGAAASLQVQGARHSGAPALPVHTTGRQIRRGRAHVSLN